MRLTGTDRRLLTVALVVLASLAAYWLAFRGMWPIDGGDSQAYYRGIYGPYGIRDGNAGYFQYSPAFLQLIAPLRLLTEDQFVLAWHVGLIASYAISLGPLLPFALFLEPVRQDLGAGNIYGWLLVAVLAGFRWPAAWSFLVLTKVTPGIGVLWFAFRREWRSFALALGATALISAVSFVLAPSAWFDWFHWLNVNAAAGVPATTGGALHVPLAPRLLAVVAMLWVGARLDWRWVVPVAVALAMPSLQETSFALVLGAIPLALGDVKRHREARGVGVTEHLRRAPNLHERRRPMGRPDAILHDDPLRAAGGAGSE